jgi:hypothetical protein
MPRRIRIALLLCDTPLPLVQKDLNFPTYEPIFVSHLRDSLASFPDKNQTEDVELEVQAFDVVGEEKYPYEDDLKRGYYDAVMMTGSGSSLLCIITLIKLNALRLIPIQLIPLMTKNPGLSALSHSSRPSPPNLPILT